MLTLEETSLFILEMAKDKSNYQQSVNSMLTPLIQHHIKLTTMPNSIDVPHWKHEMSTFSNKLVGTVYSHNNKLPTKDQFLIHVENSGLTSQRNYEKEWENIKKKYKFENPNHDMQDVKVKFEGLLSKIGDKVSKRVKLEREDF